jgi:hypothetical protein
VFFICKSGDFIYKGGAFIIKVVLLVAFMFKSGALGVFFAY